MYKTFWMIALSLLFIGCSEQKTAESENKASSSESQKEIPNYLSLEIKEDTSQWWKNAIFYEIWPRSFYDSDGDGSGDFNGMTAKLDYLVDLGVNGIWLTPVFEAPSYHGYDFQDFYSVESDYGTMEEFERFIAEAHKRDIKVILDLVLNHISDGHEWFKKSAAKEPGYEDYFVWSKEIPEGWGKAWSDEPNPSWVWFWNETRQEYYYGAFGSSQPDVNLENPKVVEELNQLATFWLEKGVDGFRLDAVRYAVEEGPIPLQADTKGTIDYWSEFTRHVKSVNPEAMLVGEAWSGLSTIGKYHNKGKGLDSAFDFDFGYVVSGILTPETALAADFGTKSTENLKNTRLDLWDNLKARQDAAPVYFFSPFLTNHDQNRIVHTLKGDLNKAKIAASLLMTTPGTLYMYYGEEIGMTQYKTGDDQYRRAIMQWSEDEAAGFNTTGKFWLDQAKWFPWVKDHKGWWADYWKSLIGTNASVSAQAKDENSLYSHYKRLIKVRNENKTLQFPEEIRFYPVNNEKVWVGEYLSGGESTWVIVNLDAAADASFELPAELSGKMTDKLTGKEIALNGSLNLAPTQTFIF